MDLIVLATMLPAVPALPEWIRARWQFSLSYSQTAAQSGRRILYESGLRAQLRRAPPEISGLGCTWALYVGGEDGVHAAQLLRAWNSPVSGAYRMHPNGYLEEAAL